MCEKGFPLLYVSAFSLAKDSSFLLNASLNSSSVPLSSCAEEPGSSWFSLMIRLSFTTSEILGINTPDYRWDSAGGKNISSMLPDALSKSNYIRSAKSKGTNKGRVVAEKAALAYPNSFDWKMACKVINPDPF